MGFPGHFVRLEDAHPRTDAWYEEATTTMSRLRQVGVGDRCLLRVQFAPRAGNGRCCCCTANGRVWIFA